MDTKTSKSGKKIYIVEKHHEILEAWEKYKESNVITLDSHKDTELCFKGKNLNREQEIKDYKNCSKSIVQIIGNLRNDEHIDFATRSGMISKVFTITHDVSSNKNENPNTCNKDGIEQNEYKEEPIIQYKNVDYVNSIFTYVNNNYPKEGTYAYTRIHALSDDFLRTAISFFERIVPNCLNKYILDIDLDYICTMYAFDTDLTKFKDLIKNAAAITISKETHCVKTVNDNFKDDLEDRTNNIKYLNEKITSEKILKRILEIIDEV